MIYRVPRRVAHLTDPPPVDDDADGISHTVYVRRVPGGPTLVLANSAALIWRLAVAGCLDVPAGIAEITGEPIEHVRDAVNAFLDQLVLEGLLQPGQPGGHGDGSNPEDPSQSRNHPHRLSSD